MGPSVSVLGLGLMGRPMARLLLDQGWELRAWNRSPLSPESVAGIPLYRDLGEAAASEILLLMLKDSEASDAVLAALQPHLCPGQLVLDMGSSDPARSEEHARRLSDLGIGWVDAPVSGGPEGATRGTLAIMAGGGEADVERALPLLRALGSNVVHVGGPGRGHTVKIINQLIVGLTIEAVAEALALAERADIDPRLVQKALQGGFADSRILQIHGTRMIQRDFRPGGKVRTQLKDLKLAGGLADALSLRLPHLASAISIYERLVTLGYGDLDHSAPHRLLLP